MRICEIARMVASKLADGKINVVNDIDESGCSGYAPDTELRLSAEKLRTLGWRPTKNLEDMYRDLFEEYAKSVR